MVSAFNCQFYDNVGNGYDRSAVQRIDVFCTSVNSDGLNRSASFLIERQNALRGVTFLSLNKKVTKEVSLGESAQASCRQFAPSPENPSLGFDMG